MISLLRDSKDLWYFTDSDGSESEHVKYLEDWDLSSLHEKWGLHGDAVLKQKLDMISNHGGSIGYNGKARDRINEWMLKTVKHDLAARNVVFDVGLSAYSSNPLNLFMKGPSSIGKTYITLQSLKPFPDEDKIILGDISPKALVHDYCLSRFVDENGTEIDLIDEAPEKDASPEDKKAWRQRLRNAYFTIDLSHKIIVFLEIPRIEIFQTLRPILSHDRYETTFKITDKTSSGRLQTKTVVIRGWPATIFCTSDRKYIEDLATRSFTVTPETTVKKIKAANQLTALKKSRPWLFAEDEDLRYVSSYVSKIREKMMNGFEVVVPYADALSEIYPSSLGRDMRDFAHIMSLIECNTYLNMFHRPRLKIRDQEYLIATFLDARYIFEMFRHFEETTRTGLSAEPLLFFHVIEEFETPPLYSEAIDRYNERYADTISSWKAYKHAKNLQEIGWLDVEDDDVDKRKKRLRVLKNRESVYDSWNPRLLALFGEKEFKSWFFDAEKYWKQNSLCIKPSFSNEVALSGLEEELLLSTLYEMYFNFQYFSDENEEGEGASNENKPGDNNFQESSTFSGDFSDEFRQWHLREGKTLEENAMEKIVERSGRDEGYAKEFIENEIASGHILRTKMGELVPVA